MKRTSTAAPVVLAGLVLAALAACSTEPFGVAPPRSLARALAREAELAGDTGKVTPWPFGLCYGGALNSQEEVMARAREICPKGQIESKGEDTFWNGCALFQPRRAIFLCYPPALPGS